MFNRDVTRESKDLREWIFRQPQEGSTPRLQVRKNMVAPISCEREFCIGVIVICCLSGVAKPYGE